MGGQVMFPMISIVWSGAVFFGCNTSCQTREGAAHLGSATEGYKRGV